MIVVQPSVNKARIMENLEKVIDSKWLGMGPMTKLFEEKLAEYWGIDPANVVCVSSCTAALHLAIQTAKIEYTIPDGSLVATTPITFVSTNHAILYNKLTPCFYDIEPRTGLVDIDSLFRIVENRKIAAIVVVHVAGQSAKMNAINDIASQHNIPVIEDCAHAMGATYLNGAIIGSSTINMSCFSFHAVKNLAMGDGGAIVLGGDWKQYSNYLRQIRWMGIDKDTFSRSKKTYSWDYDVPNLGYKAHMNDILAAVGLAQLEDVDNQNAKRKMLAGLYNKGLLAENTPAYSDDFGCNYHLYLSFFENRNEVADLLKDNGISPGMHYKRNDRYPMYRNCPTDGELHGAQWYEDHELSLPMHPNLSVDDVERVIRVIRER